MKAHRRRWHRLAVEILDSVQVIDRYVEVPADGDVRDEIEKILSSPEVVAVRYVGEVNERAYVRATHPEA